MRISDWSSDVCSSDLYDKLDADLAKAMMSINAVKAVEIGAGLEAAALSGEENADEMRLQGNRVAFTSNRAGGILGVISTGQEDRKSVVSGKSVSLRVDLGGRRIIKQKNNKFENNNQKQ